MIVNCIILLIAENTIRLGGHAANEGRIEVLINGQWGTVCDTGLGNRDNPDGYEEAHVACRQLGFALVEFITQVTYNDSTCNYC